MAKYVRKRVNEAELKLILDCKKGVTDKNGRPIAAIPQIHYVDGYAYIRVQRYGQGKVNKKSKVWTFAEALGFNMEQAYDYDVEFLGGYGKDYKTKMVFHEVEW